MKKKVFKGACLFLTMTLSVGVIGCQKNMPKDQLGNGQAVSSNEAGMSIEADQTNETFKPADYSIKAKEEYVYEYLGLKFKLSDQIRKDMDEKNIAMLDDQSPMDQDLTYAMVTFSKLTEDQKNAEVGKMGDGYEKWQAGLERVGSLGMFKKGMTNEELTKITKCDDHKKIGSSKDGEYDYYLSVKKDAKDFAEEFSKTEVEIIEKKDRPENGFVLGEKSDLENTEAFNSEAGGDLGNLSTKDINGKEFGKKDFENYDLTMVNVFATWCTACVKEIPDLATLQKEMKDKGVNVVGVVTDTVDQDGENKEALEKAKLIQSKTKAGYPFLMPDKTNFNGRLNGIQALPETFFVDKNGKIVGETYSGSHNLKDWEKIVEKELAKVKK